MHAPHWTILLGIYLSTQGCDWRYVPATQLCDRENVSVSLMGPSPVDRANVQNLGNFTLPNTAAEEEGWVWGKSRENPASLRVFPGCWRHLWDHQFPHVQTVWCEMHCHNILCQLSSTPQAMRKLVRKCSLFFHPRCLISACTALLK